MHTAGTEDRREVTFLGVANKALELGDITLDADHTRLRFEHAHFERVVEGSKCFDLTLIARRDGVHDRNFEQIPFETTLLVSMGELDKIKAFFDRIGLPHTHMPCNMNWSNIIKTVMADDHFYSCTDALGEQKHAGWDFLDIEDRRQWEAIAIIGALNGTSHL
jgi:nucleosome binding factor SPN SPT16 subunit